MTSPVPTAATPQNVRTFRAPTMREALRRVKRELGGEAVIVSSRSLAAFAEGGVPRGVEVTAGRMPVGDDTTPGGMPSADRPLGMSGRSVISETTLDMPNSLKAAEGMPLADALTAAGVDPNEITSLLEQLPPGDAGTRREHLRALLAAELPCGGGIDARAPHGPTVAAFVGPTGVGKTTSIAKLAARLSLRERVSVGLVTVDTYRIAAVEQLQTYARIIGLPLHVAATPEETAAALDALSDRDVILIDTAGRAPQDAAHLAETADLLGLNDGGGRTIETHLVLSLTTAARPLRAAADRFAALRPRSVVLTKLDEAETAGAAVGVVRRLGAPVSLLSTGQDVPDDLEVATTARLIDSLLATGVGR